MSIQSSLNLYHRRNEAVIDLIDLQPLQGRSPKKSRLSSRNNFAIR